MFRVDNQSRIPVYEQIISQVETFVINGILKAEEKLPSVRKLSVELTVNPNTVQRAYTELERAGIIITVPKRGAFVSSSGLHTLKQRRKEGSFVLFGKVVDELRVLGVCEEKIIQLVKQIYGEGSESSD